MRIGLFDLYTTGHHLPYANQVREALIQRTGYEVDFITLCGTERQTQFFDRKNIRYLDPPDSPKIEQRDNSFTDIANEKVLQLTSFVESEGYDVVHFLYIDDILGPVQRFWPTVHNTRTIGDLIGPFFTRGTPLRKKYTHPIVLEILQSSFAPALDTLVPNHTSHEALWRDILLYRSIRDSVFDEIIVHSEEAEGYIDRLQCRQSYRHIPFQVPTEYRTEFSKAEARRDLALPEAETILLFFGTLRADKGIQVLLDAVRKYDGPRFTLLIAGPPVATTAEEIASAGQTERVDIISRLEFIQDPAPYYRAVDGVVMPYQWEFGKENMSMIFQEACGSLRPIIAPNTGVLGRLTTEYNLGMTFEQGSAESLATAISKFNNSDNRFSEASMRNYANIHSKDQIMSKIAELYRSFNN